ncbi:unnamed protein product [Vicia faba]|uniref:Uncharacterized protein n=1 Tax=Vicia faba TaxID=3906 RepID=A0AAV0YFP7_VICFA|nr:unnamed protein product [Vicia faba]
MTSVNTQPHMGPYKITHYRCKLNSTTTTYECSQPTNICRSTQNNSLSCKLHSKFSPNDVGFQGSSRLNNSSVFNDFNPRLTVNLNSLNVMKDDVIPIKTPPPHHIIKGPHIFHPVTTLPHLSITSLPLCHIDQKKDLDMFCSSYSADMDPIHDKEPKSYEFDIRDTEAWKRKGKSFVSPNNCYESVPNKKNTLLIFKDEKNEIPKGSMIETNEANEKDEENLDLSLHL